MREQPETVEFSRKRLPHWQVVDGRYFVTIRLKGAIPEQGMVRIRRLRQELESMTGPDEILAAQRTLFSEMEKWLENAPSVQHLRNPMVAEMVVEAIQSREARGDWTMISYTLMPNHVHLFFHLGGSQAHDRDENTARGHRLITVLEDFKRWTACKAAELLDIAGTDFWQREWFDHWSRGCDKDEGIRRYMRLNAVKAGLVKNAEDWPYWWERE